MLSDSTKSHLDHPKQSQGGDPDPSRPSRAVPHPRPEEIDHDDSQATPCLDEFHRFLTTGQDPNGVIATDVHGEFNFPGTYFTLDSLRDFKQHLYVGTGHVPHLTQPDEYTHVTVGAALQ